MASTVEHDALAAPRMDQPTRVALVVAPYYRAIAEGLIAGATAALEAAGVEVSRLEVPGALEIPTAIALMDRAGRYDGYVALGCVIRGETTHYDIVAGESSRALTDLGLNGICIGNGILTVEDMAQAQARALPDRMDKGGGAAIAVLHLIKIARAHRPARIGEGEFLLADTPKTGGVA